VSGQIVEHRPTLADVRTRALELEGDGTPLLLFHGYADSADTWRLLLDRLRKQGRAAVAVDLPGFGQADPLRPDEPILPQFDAFLAAAVERWSEESGEVVLAGNSLGGTAALRAAERDGGRLVAGVVPVAPAGLDMPLWFAAIQGAPVVRAVLNSPVPVPEVAVRQAVGTAYRVLAFARQRGVDGSVVNAFASHFKNRRDVARVLSTGRNLLPELAAPFRLERIRCPVLVVWGERDRMVFKTGAGRISREIPDARVELIPDCGHCPQIEEPDLLAGLLAGFPRGA
jgi:pimeloyl-ACP methyl ester carboxylesterase